MFTAIGLNNIIVGFREMQEVSARNRSFLSDRVRETLRSLGASVPATPQQQDASQENIPGLLSPDIQISFPRRNFHLFEGPILRIGSAPHGDGYQTDICASTFSENPQIYHDILAKYGLLARQEIHVSVEASSPQAGSVPDWYRFEQANVLSSDFVQKYKDTYRLIITNRRVSYFLLPHELAMRALGSCLMVGGKALLTDVFGGNKHITQFRLSDSQGEQQYFFLKDDQSFLVYENWCSFQRNLGEHFFEGDEGQRYHMQIFDNFFIYQKTEASLEESILFYAGHAAKSGDPTNTDGLIVITRLE